MVSAIFVAKRIKGALVLGIILTTLLAIPIGRWWGGTDLVSGVPLISWQGLLAMPNFSLFLQLDLLRRNQSRIRNGDFLACVRTNSQYCSRAVVDNFIDLPLRCCGYAR